MTDPALFIRLYLDEDVSVFLAQLLRPHGFEVLTTRETQNLGSSDAVQLQFQQPASTPSLPTIVVTSNSCTKQRSEINGPMQAFSSPAAVPQISNSPDGS